MIEAVALSAWYGPHQVLRNIDLRLENREVTAIIGPSGSGKSTFVRCVNRMHEMTPGTRTSGQVKLGGENVYAKDVDPVLLRRRVGLVFQVPNPFPNMSIRENVTSGLAMTGRLDEEKEPEVVESALAQVALWDDVKDRLDQPGTQLSGGEQQRLCIARAIATEPDVLLMDEPCSSLDPIATARIEDLIHALKERYCIVIVTHNLQQATRISEKTAFFLGGRVVEMTPTDDLFTAPKDPRTEDYITGRFG